LVPSNIPHTHMISFEKGRRFHATGVLMRGLVFVAIIQKSTFIIIIIIIMSTVKLVVAGV